MKGGEGRPRMRLGLEDCQVRAETKLLDQLHRKLVALRRERHDAATQRHRTLERVLLARPPVKSGAEKPDVAKKAAGKAADQAEIVPLDTFRKK